MSKITRIKATCAQIPRPLNSPGHTGRNTYTPGAKFLERYEAEQAAEVRGFMAWNLAAGLAYAANRAIPPAGSLDWPTKNAGRCLWSWEDLVGISADVPSAEVPTTARPYLDALKEQALRPTAAFPADMRSISPRLCIDLLGGVYSRAKREVEVILGITLPNALRLDQSLGLVMYGDLQDKAIPLMSRVRTQFPKRPGFSQRSTYLMEVVSDGVEPFAVGVLKHTLFEDDLAPRLLGSKDTIAAKCRELYSRLGAYLEDDFLQNYAGIVDRVLREEWHLDEFDPEDPEPDAEQVLERLVIWQYHDNRRLGAELFLGLALLTGVSPAAITAYAVSDARRRGYTYIGHEEVLRLAALVEDTSMNAAAARCAKEIRGHAVELIDAQAGKQDVIEKLARVGRARTLGQVFWEFEGRLTTG